MSTISGTINNGIVFGTAESTGTYTSPLTITASGLIDAGSGDAIHGDNSASWAVVNDGTVAATGASGDGIDLRGGGTIDNAAGTALIAGYDNGVYITGAAGTVSNAGTIEATGTSGRGVYLTAGGSVTNTGTGLIEGGLYGIGIGTAGTVANSGTILGTGIFGYGIRLVGDSSVANTGTGLIAGYNGVHLYTGTVSNAGTILGTTSDGVYLRGGSVSNAAGGLIQGGNAGVEAFVSAATVANSGAITGGLGVAFFAGGSIDNQAGGSIQGAGDGVYVNGGGGTLTNAGTILSTGNFGIRINYGGSGGSVDNATTAGLIEGGTGIYIFGAAATVTNAGTILGTTGIGVDLANGGTVVDSGTISGSGTAIHFGGAGSNLLVLENGYQLSGGVAGSGAATDTLELAGTVGAAVTADYNALGLTSFENVLFGGGGYSTLLVSNIAGTLGVTISGFDAATEVIDLTGIGGNGTITNRDTVNDRITVTGSSGSVTLQFDSIDTINFTASPDGGGGTELTPVCYCRGTQILTDRGEVPVEDLAVGDRVLTISGEAKPVKWVGHRAYDGRFVAGNRAMLPVRIAAGALADGVPVRDLCVSPGHALLIAGMLVRAENLVNGATITQDTAVERVEYFHVELEMHDVIIADGAPAESYIDCDNRGKFHNAADFARLYPDDERPHWQFCAPLLDWDSPEPNTIREALMTRAEKLGHKL
ncbi:MAG TPA: Hint domain-containing protein, partial [Stellaceae bacterium]|nr:Hint domain-containing protein [Stellaceae bacterium]